MEHVENAEFYHIHKIGFFDDIWQVGKAFVTPKKRNLFNSFYDDHPLIAQLPNDPATYTIRAALQRVLKDPKGYDISFYINMIKLLDSAFQEECMFVRETIFEEIRRDNFSDLPSRQRCIWILSKDAVSYWWHVLAKENTKCKIFKLNATGVIHRADEKHLIADTITHSDLRNRAFKYWSGTDRSDPIKEEILFEGKLQIIEEYQNLEDFYKPKMIEYSTVNVGSYKPTS